jgi:hypothetical protein
MHPSTQYELMQARTADYHRRAEDARLARAAIHARRAQRQRGASPRSDLVRRLLRVPRRWQPSRDAAT